MAKYRSLTYVPPLVKRAMNLAEQMDYSDSCSEDAGRLLQLLVSQFQSGVIAELDTGCGVAASWIVSALNTGTSFFTVASDPARAAAVRTLFDPLLNVRVIQGDWRELIRNWRFSMLYVGRHSARLSDPDLLLQSLREGSLLVLDGLLSPGRISFKLESESDRVRETWLNESRVLATEVQVSPKESVILATRIA